MQSLKRPISNHEDSGCKDFERTSVDIAVSVVIPTRNRPLELSRALTSVERQTRTDFEIIVVDDASTTPYSHNMSVEDRIVRLSLPEHSGPAIARNAGIAAAHGEWIAFLDDDDEWDARFLEVVLDRLEREAHGASFAWSGFINLEYSPEGELVGGKPRSFASHFPDEEALFSEALSIGAGCGLTVHRSCFEDIGLFRTEYELLEDTDLLFRLLAGGCTPIAVPEVLVRIHHHRSEDRLTSMAHYPVRIAEFQRLLKANAAFLERYPYIRGWMWDYCDQLERDFVAYRGTIHDA